RMFGSIRCYSARMETKRALGKGYFDYWYHNDGFGLLIFCLYAYM
ncbi:uncharacterized protein METZ01_LOCUS281373, partial [marine metagenome]